MKTLICFYSVYGHVYTLAKAVAEGVRLAGGEPVLRTVAETLPQETLKRIGAVPDAERGADLPAATPDDLLAAGAILFGSPTRFGCMCAQMRAFLDSTGGLWAKYALAGKVGGSFVSTGTQHGGQETTHFSFHTYMMHHGILIAPVPYNIPELNATAGVCGGSPYGAGTIAGVDGSRAPTSQELEIARQQGKFITEIALKLSR